MAINGEWFFQSSARLSFYLMWDKSPDSATWVATVFCCYFFELGWTHSNTFWLSIPQQHVCRGALRWSTETLDLLMSLRLSESLADDIILTVIMYVASLWVIALQLIILRQCLEGSWPLMAKINRDPILHDADWVHLCHRLQTQFSSRLTGDTWQKPHFPCSIWQCFSTGG